MESARSIIDHVDLLVADLEASRRFYAAALAPLGLGPVSETDTFTAYGAQDAYGFAINLIAEGDTPTRSAHVAFHAANRAEVHAFYDAALAAGGRSKLPPALHPEYSETYYGAFVYDPDGNNIEAVCFTTDET